MSPFYILSIILSICCSCFARVEILENGVRPDYMLQDEAKFSDSKNFIIKNNQEDLILSFDSQHVATLIKDDDLDQINTHLKFKMIFQNPVSKIQIGTQKDKFLSFNDSLQHFDKEKRLKFISESQNIMFSWLIKYSKNQDNSYVIINENFNCYLRWSSTGTISCDKSCDFGLCERNMALDEDEVLLEENYYWQIDEV